VKRNDCKTKLGRKPLLMFVTGRRVARYFPLEEIIESSCRSGIDFVQLREKDLTSIELLWLAKRLSPVVKRYKSCLIINDRLDIALITNAAGVHSPADGIPAKYLKEYPELVSGKSVHNLSEAVRAERDGYDYIIFGPVFSTPSKARFGAPLGIKMLQQVCNAVQTPVFAIGGVTPERAARCIRVGASGVAIRGSILRARSVPRVIAEFRKCLNISM